VLVGQALGKWGLGPSAGGRHALQTHLLPLPPSSRACASCTRASRMAGRWRSAGAPPSAPPPPGAQRPPRSPHRPRAAWLPPSAAAAGAGPRGSPRPGHPAHTPARPHHSPATALDLNQRRRGTKKGKLGTGLPRGPTGDWLATGANWGLACHGGQLGTGLPRGQLGTGLPRGPRIGAWEEPQSGTPWGASLAGTPVLCLKRCRSASPRRPYLDELEEGPYLDELGEGPACGDAHKVAGAWAGQGRVRVALVRGSQGAAEDWKTAPMMACTATGNAGGWLMHLSAGLELSRGKDG